MAEKIIIILLFQLTINLVVFPFKTAYVNRNGEITSDNIEYNTTHFAQDNIDESLYTGHALP